MTNSNRITAQAVCIGGGYIGMECAAALAMNGLDVSVGAGKWANVLALSFERG